MALYFLHYKVGVKDLDPHLDCALDPHLSIILRELGVDQISVWTALVPGKEKQTAGTEIKCEKF